MSGKNDRDNNGKLMKKQKIDVVTEFLALPVDTMRNFPTIQIRGNREIVIDGCNSLLSYDSASVVIDTRFCRIDINGKELKLRNFNDKIISVKGLIRKIEFNM